MKIHITWILPLCFLLVFPGVESNRRSSSSSSSSSPDQGQPYRTAYHFQPPKNWMNDPNGPIYYKGIYHLFYQYNPYGAVWGNIVWAHSVSYDLVNWIHLDPAISPTDPFDINGCWSGSTTLLPGEKPAILYTGADSKNQQVQNLALPKNLSDPLLREWVKSPHNPLISPNNNLEPNNFRDPTTAWLGPDKRWRIIVGTQINGHGMATLYHSTDFVQWTRKDRPLHSSGKTRMWECPDFYPVGIERNEGLDTSALDNFTRHVLKASFSDSDHYILGNYVPENDLFSVETDFMDDGLDLRYDYGKFYASKTFYDSRKKRRVLWGWILEEDTEQDDISKGWSGLQSIPRSVLLSKSGRQLVQWPVEELKKLRTKSVSFHDIELKSGSVFEISGILTSQADVEVSFKLLDLKEAELIEQNWVDPQLLCKQKEASVRGKFGPFGLLILASADLKEQTAVFFRIFRKLDNYIVLMCSDQSRSSLREGLDKPTYGTFLDLDPRRENISLRSLIDHSIVESFGGEGRSCITARAYPSLAIDQEAHLYVFNNGTTDITVSKLTAWSMKKAQIGPITRRRKPHLS